MSFPEADEFRALLDRLFEDRITPQEVARLEELMLARPEAEAYYVQSLGLYADLAHALAAPTKSAEEALRRRLGAAAPPLARTPGRSTPRRMLRFVAAAAAALVSVLAAGWWAFPRMFPAGKPRAEVVTGELSPFEEAPAERFSNTVALVRDDSSAEWEPGTAPIHTGSTLPPGHLHLKSGFAEIEFYSGATVVLEGPADFEIVSSMEAFCTRGKLRASVPPHAKGFTIGTPRLNLVDRGTEFGMRVDGAASTEVHVFEGKVELYKAGDDRRTLPDRELTTGQAVRIDAEESTSSIASNAREFLSSGELVARTQAAARVRQREWEVRRDLRSRDPSLSVYYSFEPHDVRSRTLKNQIAGNSSPGDGTIVGCNWGPGRWPGKMALDFRQVSDRVRLHIPGEFDSLTVALWACIDGLPNRFNSLLMSENWEAFEGHWHISNQRTIQLGVRGTARDSSARYTSQKLSDSEFLGRWTHFALVYDRAGRRVTQYLNGQPLSELPLVLDAPLRLGETELGNWTPGSVNVFPERFLTGRIDEFLLYSRVLAPKEIQELAEEFGGEE